MTAPWFAPPKRDWSGKCSPVRLQRPRAPGPKGLVSSRFATEIRAIGADHSEYPAGLRDLDDAPATLFTCGALPPPPPRSVAIVGSRAATPYGRAMAERLASDLARLGYGVVSGLARGIDAAAHRGAMQAGGRTWAAV